MRGLHPDRRQCAPAGLGENAANLAATSGIDRCRPCQDHGLSAGEPGERLPQQAAGEEMATTIGVGGIHGHDVEVAGETPVLEAVVEQRYFRPRMR